MNPAIVCIGYNRPQSLLALLESVCAADYGDARPTLVISLDAHPDKPCLQVANDFAWPYGEKRIVQHTERMGLKKHVLSCGDLVHEFESIIMLEDDIRVAPQFYAYASQALEHYNEDDKIAGVSLYTHAFNFQVKLPFQPIITGDDCFFLQFPNSWGQAWTATQWAGFRNWFAQSELHPDLPQQVKNWPETSWLKWYASYCMYAQKTWVYPYQSLSTNNGEAGTNAKFKSATFQVPMYLGKKKNWKFPSISNSLAVYDAYFENASPLVQNVIGAHAAEFNLYGNKKLNKYRSKYVVEMGDQGIKNFALNQKPWDTNVYLQIPGNGIRLVEAKDMNPKALCVHKLVRIAYLYPIRLGRKEWLKLALKALWNKGAI